ncbi:MAG: hypothetical protein KDD25_04885 [Bdellovibrionales bacterium]|nr:hypothetical protein [Bdellovibrionales bacterium]
MKVLVSLILLFSIQAEAKLFKNSYVSFELPERWNCNLEGTEWVCQSTDQVSSKQAIIILTAKEVGPSDSLALYDSYLKKAKSSVAKDGKPFLSQVKNVTQRKIADQEWVDGLHLGSEIPSFYTRYLATVKRTIAILVTFSAHKQHFTKYSPDFLRAIGSLRVTATADLLNSPSGQPGIRGAGGSLGSTIAGAFPDDMMLDEGEIPAEPKGSGNTGKLLALLSLALVILGGYYFYSKKS